jgi:hypothetical protein
MRFLVQAGEDKFVLLHPVGDWREAATQATQNLPIADGSILHVYELKEVGRVDITVGMKIVAVNDAKPAP